MDWNEPVPGSTNNSTRVCRLAPPADLESINAISIEPASSVMARVVAAARSITFEPPAPVIVPAVAEPVGWVRVRIGVDVSRPSK